MTLTNVKRFSVFVFAVVLLSSCANSAHIEKDHSIVPGNYKTFSWAQNEKNDSTPANHKNDLANANIRRAVNEQLQKNGFTEVKKNPDVLLTYDLLVEKTIKEESDPVYSRPFRRIYSNPYTGRYGTLYYPSRFMGYDNRSTPVREGTVTISMIDTKTDKTIWQGWTTNYISNNNITGKEIERNVKSIFKKFDLASR